MQIFNKTVNSVLNVCKHSFPEIHEVKLRTLTERHAITFQKQLINLLFQPAWVVLVKLGEINMIPLIILSKAQFHHRFKIFSYNLQVYDKYRLLHVIFSYHTLYQPEVMISPWEPIGSRDDIWTWADKGLCCLMPLSTIFQL